jgi:hypothetical protein
MRVSYETPIVFNQVTMPQNFVLRLGTHNATALMGSLGHHVPSVANLSGKVTSTVTKFATSVFQYDDPLTLNAQGHGHNFINRM